MITWRPPHFHEMPATFLRRTLPLLKKYGRTPEKFPQKERNGNKNGNEGKIKNGVKPLA